MLSPVGKGHYCSAQGRFATGRGEASKRGLDLDKIVIGRYK